MAAGIPDGLESATKSHLPLEMIQDDALDAGVSVDFVAAVEACGRDPLLRNGLQERAIGYVLAVARNHYAQVTTHLKERVDVTESWLSQRAWQRYSCRPGSKGNRWYEWAWVSICHDGPGLHTLLIRHASDGELVPGAAPRTSGLLR